MVDEELDKTHLLEFDLEVDIMEDIRLAAKAIWNWLQCQIQGLSEPEFLTFSFQDGDGVAIHFLVRLYGIDVVTVLTSPVVVVAAFSLWSF
ncbi:hypothetical protein Tco_1027419, partial [Tanacetum coccineum]